MKTPLALALALSILTGSLLTSAPASAASFSPSPILFTLSGTMSLKKTSGPLINCTANMMGHTDASGAAWIDTASLTGGALCPLIAPANLPWTLTPTGPVSLQIVNVSFSSSIISYCGPGSLPAHLDPSGQISFSNTLPGSCTINGALNSMPALVINYP